jgi:hypothetical protein
MVSEVLVMEGRRLASVASKRNGLDVSALWKYVR